MKAQGHSLIRKPLKWGTFAGGALLAAYFLIVTAASSFSHAIEQFQEMWYWITLLVFGFGLQVGLFAYIRVVSKLRQETGVAASSMAVAGGTSTTAMAACCAHHIADVLPILGVSAASVFLNQFQDLFMIIGVMSNLIGVTLMLRIIQKHGLYQKDRGVLALFMRMDMRKSLYFTGVLSTFVIAFSLYKSL